MVFADACQMSRCLRRPEGNAFWDLAGAGVRNGRYRPREPLAVRAGTVSPAGRAGLAVRLWPHR